MKQGKALKHNIGIAKWYNDELQAMCKKMQDDTLKGIKPLYADYIAQDSAFDITVELKKLRDKYVEYFYKYGKQLSKKFIERSVKYANISVKKALEPIAKKELKFALKGSIINDSNRDIVKMAIFNNVSYIRSIPEEYFKDITGAVTRSMEFGGSIASLQKEIEHTYGVTQRRAKLIAYDQTRKVYSDLSLQKMKDAGFTKVKWVHSNAGEVPRCFHVHKWDGHSEPPNGLNGYIFDINNPPVIQKAKGKREEVRGFPAQLINCRCFLVPVEDDEI